MKTIHSRDSYYEEFKRHHARNAHKNGSTLVDTKLLTDRSAYMAYLEVQLERVTTACMTVQAYKDRLSQFEDIQNDCKDDLHNVCFLCIITFTTNQTQPVSLYMIVYLFEIASAHS